MMITSGSVEKTLDLLMIFGCNCDSKELTLNQVTLIAKLPKTTVHRLLRKLVEKQLVEQNAVTHKYLLGVNARVIGERYVYSHPIELLMQELLKQLVRDFEESASVSYLDGHETVILDKMEGTHALRAIAQVGNRNPIHCSGSGKVFLAWMEEGKAKELLERIAPLRSYTKATFTNIDSLLQQLKLEKPQGYIVDNEELHQGQLCISAPVYSAEGRVIAALTVSGPKERITDKGINVIGNQLRDYCLKISRELGFVPCTEESV